MLPIPTPLPPLFPRLHLCLNERDQDPLQPRTSPIHPRYNQSYRSRNDSNDNQFLDDIDREEAAMHAMNARIAAHGQTYLRPPGLDTLLSASYYEGQEQLGTPTQPDETFVHEEDEEGFIPSGEEEEEEGEDYEDGTEELEEDLEEEQDLDADIEVPSDASYSSGSLDATPMQLRNEDLREVRSPATPSMQPRMTLDIDALSDLVDAMQRNAAEGLPESTMDLEELLEEEEVQDLDAEIEDMDEFQSSFVEEDSMEL